MMRKQCELFLGNFTIDAETGEVILISSIRNGEANYTLDIVATDNGDPKLSGSCALLILVTDVNLNSPVIDEFPSSVGVLEVRKFNFYMG